MRTFIPYVYREAALGCTPLNLAHRSHSAKQVMAASTLFPYKTKPTNIIDVSTGTCKNL